MADVFLSHASTDYDAAARLEQALVEAGLSVWWDHKLVSGQRFQATIISELNSASAVVVVWSATSAKSDWVYSEARRASDQGKLVQVRTDELDPDDLPAPFDTLHCPLVSDLDAVVHAARSLVDARGAPGVTTPRADVTSPDRLEGRSQQRSLPGGTVTLLVAQVDSLVGLSAHPIDADVEGLDAARSILREAWPDHRGLEYDAQGERVYVAFDTATEGVAAAGDAQRRLQRASESGSAVPPVRMGVHSGSPRLHGGEYVGIDVHRVSMIAGAAHGGQVVLSVTTKDLVGDRLPRGARLRDLGVHRLRDLPQAEHLFQLVVPGVDSTFEGLRSLGTAMNLPRPATPLVGREQELQELVSRLSAGAPLVTLTGPGGVGKTRLAIEVAGRLEEHFGDGVYFVDLVAATTADVMWSTIGEVLDLPPEERRPPGMFDHIAHLRLLFVLDNLEQVADADVVTSELLDRSPGSAVLATSRRALTLADEHVHPVEPLDVPAQESMAEALESSAVALFVQRARMQRPGFALTPDDASAVIQICRLLDGLPLAIELAAARIRMLSPRALLSRLDQSLDLAAVGKLGPLRQQTLRRAMAWSYELLGQDQQRLLSRLSVFAGGCDLDALAAVCTPASDVDPLDTVTGLVDLSLVTVSEDADGEPRLGLLTTVRAFAAEQLSIGSESEEVRSRHLRHYCDRATDMGHLMFGPDNLAARRWFKTEIDNVRVALEWSLRPPEQGVDGAERRRLALRLSVNATVSWFAAGVPDEGRRWLERSVVAAGDEDTVELVHALVELAAMVSGLGPYDEGLTYALRAVEMGRRVAEPGPLAMALEMLADIRAEAGDLAEATALLEEAMALARASGDVEVLCSVTSTSAWVAGLRGAHGDALRHLDVAFGLADSAGARPYVLGTRNMRASELLRMGQPSRALAEMRETIPESVALGFTHMYGVPDNLAMCLAQLGQAGEAAMLIGAADAMYERDGVRRPPTDQSEHESTLTLARSALADEDWQEAYAAGRAMTVPDALMRALSDVSVEPGA